MAITVNLRYTGKKGAAQAFAREMISSGTVEKIRAEKLKPAGNTSCSIDFAKSSVEYWSGSLNGGIKVT